MRTRSWNKRIGLALLAAAVLATAVPTPAFAGEEAAAADEATAVAEEPDGREDSVESDGQEESGSREDAGGQEGTDRQNESGGQEETDRQDESGGQETVHTHTWTAYLVTKKATFSADGLETSTCTGCGKTRNRTIKKADTAVLSTTKYRSVGKARKPGVTVTDSAGKKLVKGTDYTLSYDKGRIKPGKYHVVVNLKGKYAGKKKLTFTILSNTGKIGKSGKWIYKSTTTKSGKSQRVKKGYRFKDGSYPVGVTRIGKTYYYFTGVKGTLSRSGKAKRLVTSGSRKFCLAGNGTVMSGWQVVEDKLYYFGGKYHSAVCGDTKDQIKLTESGEAAASLEASIKKSAILLLESITDRSASREIQLRAVYQYMASGGHFHYSSAKYPNLKEKKWAHSTAYDMMTTRAGNCYSFAAMLAAMAHEIGYKDVQVYCGRVHGSRDRARDGFTRHAVTVINGHYYDAEAQFAGWRRGIYNLSGYPLTFKNVSRFSW